MQHVCLKWTLNAHFLLYNFMKTGRSVVPEVTVVPPPFDVVKRQR